MWPSTHPAIPCPVLPFPLTPLPNPRHVADPTSAGRSCLDPLCFMTLPCLTYQLMFVRTGLLNLYEDKAVFMVSGHPFQVGAWLPGWPPRMGPGL